MHVSNKKIMLLLLTVMTLSFILLLSPVGNNEPRQPQRFNDVQRQVIDRDLAILDASEHALTISVYLEQAEYDEWLKLVQEYTERYPNVKIDTVRVDYAHAYEQYKRQGTMGQNADVMLFDNVWVREFAGSGLLAPLAEITPDPAGGGSIPALAEQIAWNNMIWGAPIDADPYVLVWNDEELQTIDEGPLAPHQWDEMFEWVEQWQNERTDSKGGARYGLYFNAADPYAFSAFAQAMGELAVSLWFMDDEADEGDEGDEMPQVDAQHTLWLQPGPEADPWDFLKQGKLLFMIAPLSEAVQHAEPHVKYASLPASDREGEAPLWIRGRSYVISADTDEFAAAWKWIREMTSYRSQRNMSQATNTLPASLEAAADWERVFARSDVSHALETARTLGNSLDLPRRLERYKETAVALAEGTMDLEAFMKTNFQTMNPASFLSP